MAIQTETYRLNKQLDTGFLELYDHRADPGEFTNLASDPRYGDVVDELTSLLDGGWRAWLSAGGAEEVSVPPLRAGSYVPRPGSGWVTTAQLERELVGGACVLVDARSGARFRGEHEPIDPVAGHVPGAVNRPHTENLSPDGSFLPSTELATQ